MGGFVRVPAPPAIKAGPGAPTTRSTPCPGPAKPAITGAAPLNARMMVAKIALNARAMALVLDECAQFMLHGDGAGSERYLVNERGVIPIRP